MNRRPNPNRWKKRLADIVPIGYLAIREATEKIARSLFMGVKDREDVTRLRQAGLRVGDGKALDSAFAEIWKAADAGKLRVFGIGGNPATIVKLDPEDLKGIPFLRSPRGGKLHFLRPTHRLHAQLAKWFGAQLMDVAIAFEEREVDKLSRSLVQRRRKDDASDGLKKKTGRPARLPEVGALIQTIVESKRWTPTQSIKALTRLVNRADKSGDTVSADTVGRALDELFKETGDRLYERPKRRQRAAG
jgi:hypothetical protein